MGPIYSLHVYKNGFPLQNPRSAGQSSAALTSAHLLRFAEDRFATRSSHLQKHGSKTCVLGPNRVLEESATLDVVEAAQESAT